MPTYVAALFLILGVAVSDAYAQDTTDTAQRCRAPEYREFDFWLGRWEVRNAAGELQGRSEIQRVVGGCGIIERWHGAGGGSGVSVNAYDPALGKWTQRWVGVGAVLWLQGALEDGRMVLRGTGPRGTPRGDVLDRLTWTPLPDGRVRQTWETSSDGGSTWRESFAGFYTRTQ